MAKCGPVPERTSERGVQVVDTATEEGCRCTSCSVDHSSPTSPGPLSSECTEYRHSWAAGEGIGIGREAQKNEATGLSSKASYAGSDTSAVQSSVTQTCPPPCPYTPARLQRRVHHRQRRLQQRLR